jgi:hypothetical protein
MLKCSSVFQDACHNRAAHSNPSSHRIKPGQFVIDLDTQFEARAWLAPATSNCRKNVPGNERQTRHKHEVDDEILQGSQTGDNAGVSQYLLVSERLREQDWEVDEMDSEGDERCSRDVGIGDKGKTEQLHVARTRQMTRVKRTYAPRMSL